MDLNRYNTRVRQAMSDAYVDCSKRRNKIRHEFNQLQEKLENEKEIIPYAEYKRLCRKLEDLEKEYERLRIEWMTWDKAREICMEIADEMCEKVK